MESIYYVLSWACHRRCKHCYETRFRPYVRGALRAVVEGAKAAFPQVIANLPEDFTYLDLDAPSETAPGGYERRPGRLILAGGELLIDPVREEVLYPALEAIAARYAAQGVRIVVQTTGDLVTPEIVRALLARGVWMISCAGMDDFHVGMEGDRRVPLQQRLREIFEAEGMIDSALPATERDWSGQGEAQPCYSMFGATEDAWIGKIWPRGRAWENSLSKATIRDNFCNAWSGGLNFLKYGQAGSEVSIEPDGQVYPCCLKTAAPLGDLREESLVCLLTALKDEPALQAIDRGDPAAMGEAHGWSRQDFIARSTKTMPTGQDCSNLCLGCDSFFAEVMSPILERAAQERRGRRRGAE